MIPEHLASILGRLGLDSQAWCDVVKKFGRMFKRAAGTSKSLAQEARRRDDGKLQQRLKTNAMHA